MTLRPAFTDTSVAAANRAGPMPKRYRAFGRALNGLALLSPTLAGRILTRLWFTPVHGRPGSRTQAFWASAHRRLPLCIGPDGIDLYCWGDPQAPLILGVHGWRGSGSQFRQLVTPLVDAGYQVCLFDLPGHGQNPSRSTHLYEFAQVLVAIQQQLGRPAGVIAHSLGAQAVVQAMAQGLAPTHLALIAPGLEVRGLVDRFSEALGLTASVQAAFERQLTDYSLLIAEAHLGVAVTIWDRVSLDFARHYLNGPGLVVIDRDDEEVAAADLERTLVAWPQAQPVRTRGLGHSGPLRDAEVRRQLTQYFQRLL